MLSPVGAAVHVALLAAAVIAMIRTPALAPSCHQLFYPRFLAIVPLTLFVAQFPLVLLHEAMHALAGRRLGLPSDHNGWSGRGAAAAPVPADPRRHADRSGGAGRATPLATATMRADGTVSVLGGFLLALAYTTLLRTVWQFSFFRAAVRRPVRDRPASVHTVVTKRAISLFAARSAHPATARDAIRAAAEAVLADVGNGKLTPIDVPAELVVEAEFRPVGAADAAARVPGTERTGARSVRRVMPGLLEMMDVISIWSALAGLVSQ